MTEVCWFGNQLGQQVHFQMVAYQCEQRVHELGGQIEPNKMRQCATTLIAFVHDRLQLIIEERFMVDQCGGDECKQPLGFVETIGWTCTTEVEMEATHDRIQ